MAQGEEHTLDDNQAHEGDTRPNLGWYCLNDFGILTAPILGWLRKHEKLLKLIPTAGKIFEWVFDDKWSNYLKGIAKASDLRRIPKSALASKAPGNLPIHLSCVLSEWIGRTIGHLRDRGLYSCKPSSTSMNRHNLAPLRMVIESCGYALTIYKN